MPVIHLTSDNLPYGASFLDFRAGEPSTTGHHYSTCLFYEPRFREVKAATEFKRLYIDRIEDISKWRREAGHSLSVYCDATMHETALAVEGASVTVVSDRSHVPWHQHLWRYYSALRDDAPNLIHHFRGMDNVTCDYPRTIELFAETGYDLMHGPYVRPLTSEYFPVRGSCSLNRKAVAALRRWLVTNPAEPRLDEPAEGTPPDDMGRAAFHTDERWLRRFYRKHAGEWNSVVIIDRLPDSRWFEDFAATVAAGRKTLVLANPKLKGFVLHAPAPP